MALLALLGSPAVMAAQPRLAPVSLRPVRAAHRDAPTGARTRAPLPCPLRQGAWWKNPLRATGVMATPVALVAAVVADQHRGRAAAGAMAGGAAYAVGATAYWAASSCDKVDGLMYLWTPVAAAAGAVLATR
ncbi:MAG: hypothetical protein K2R93_12810 [Gemmatimonadaceae bacterium]|nr:hypothetical protein [Gemmatimonadaceae bacterium]